MKLFRHEVLAARSGDYLGSIRIGQPPSFGAVTGVSLLLAVAFLAFASWGQVTRKARIAGVLMPVLGSLQLTASTAGVLREHRVVEGEAVRAGQTLFVLDVDRSTEHGETAALVTQSLRQRRGSIEAERAARTLQAQQRKETLAERVRSTETQLLQADAEAELAQRRVDLAVVSAERYRQLAREGFVSDIQSQQKQEELIDLQARWQAAGRTRLSLRNELVALKSDFAATMTQLAADLSQLDRAVASLNQESAENDARRQIAVTAPQAGTVTGLTLSPGASVQTGQTLATLVPQSKAGSPSELEAQLYAPSRTAGFVRPGQVVWLRYAAYPYEKFGMAQGEVSAVSKTPISPADLPAGQGQALIAAAQSNEPLYRISVKLERQGITTYGEARPLKSGMTLDADVLQDRRAVWEWVLEPLIAASGMVKILGATPNKASPGG